MSDLTPNIPNTVESLPIVIWQGAPVITTELLASVYETDAKNIQMNFKNNAERFIEGKHFFKLQGADLKEFNLQPNNIGLQISSMTRSLMLWTERGTVRHAKMLGTDKAWEVQDKLEEFYFNRNKIPQTLSGALLLAGELAAKNEKLIADNAKLNTIIDNEFGYSSILRAAIYAGVHEKTFSWKTLKAISNGLGMPPKRVPSPRFEYQNLYPIKAFQIAYPHIDFDDLTPELVEDKAALAILK